MKAICRQQAAHSPSCSIVAVLHERQVGGYRASSRCAIQRLRRDGVACPADAGSGVISAAMPVVWSYVVWLVDLVGIMILPMGRDGGMNKSFDLILQSVDKRRMTNTPHTPSAPALFDQKTIRLRLQRAMRHGPADFLLARVADDLVDRLAVLTKRFPDALDWASCGPHGAEVLATVRD